MSRRAARRRERKQPSNLDETATSAENVGQSCSEWSNASFSVNKKDPKKWERGKKITANPLLKPKSKVQVPEPPPPAPPPPPTTTTLPMSSATTTGNHLNPFSVGLLRFLEISGNNKSHSGYININAIGYQIPNPKSQIPNLNLSLQKLLSLFLPWYFLPPER